MCVTNSENCGKLSSSVAKYGAHFNRLSLGMNIIAKKMWQMLATLV
jgi:hypothetical protein